jgi:hypothetical protein
MPPSRTAAAVTALLRKISISSFVCPESFTVEPCKICPLSFHGDALYASSIGSAMSRTKRVGAPCECSLVPPGSHAQYRREPHPGDTMGPGILRKSIRKLMLKPDEFMEFLKEC